MQGCSDGDLEMNYSVIMEVSLIAGIGFALLSLILFFVLRVPFLIHEVTGRSRQMEAEAYVRGRMSEDERYFEETLQQTVSGYGESQTGSEMPTEKMKSPSETAVLQSTEEGTVRMAENALMEFKILEWEMIVHDNV